MEKQNEFPIHKKDNLGRIIYTKWNDKERVIKKYWGDTNKIKILYKFYSDEEITIDVFNLNNKNILSYKSGNFWVNLERFKIKDEDLVFTISRKNMNTWKSLIKNDN